jgi:RNA polymerase nonessential primary-like sigma factor
LVKTLDERELQVIRMRYGLSNGEVTSLSDIGSEFGVTASRIKQIEEQSMEKLRSSYTNRSVEPYLEDELGEETRPSNEYP